MRSSLFDGSRLGCETGVLSPGIARLGLVLVSHAGVRRGGGLTRGSVTAVSGGTGVAEAVAVALLAALFIWVVTLAASLSVLVTGACGRSRSCSTCFR